MDRSSLGAALERIVGAGHVFADPDRCAGYEVDWTGRWRGRAAFVVRPADSAEVAAVVRACAAAGGAIVPQGGNTGLVGGSVPRGGEVLLSLRRLDGIEPVDGGSGGLVAGAGATLADVRRAAAAAGFGFGVDIAPRDSCTVGGMIATNAGGMHVVRHGMMAEQVVGIEAVLADGSLVGRVPALLKDNAGYRIGALLVGSEGTLGIVVRAHLRLVAVPAARAAALVAFDDAASAIVAIAELRRRLPSLSALEILFREALDLALDATGGSRPFARDCGGALLVECAGADGVDEELASALAALGEASRDAVFASGAAVGRLWLLREVVPEAIARLGVPHKMDVSLPLAAIPGFARAVRERIEAIAPGSRTILFGHGADGNLHVNVLGLAPGDDRVDEAVLDLAAAAGGSIAAEHGIGVAKVAALARSAEPARLAAMGLLKRSLDPGGLLNPGVILAG
ncbi:MAG: hypothetical protein RL698_2956 [Pseudomonadota bacterium]|jgi:FAD/FMN-containing dehydrogenase